MNISKGADFMIKKRLTAFLMVFTFLFTLVPAASFVAFADANGVCVADGKLMLADFGNPDSVNIRKQDDAFEYTNEIAYEGKDTSMKFTLSESNKELDIIPPFQRDEWPASGDLKFRIHNSGSDDNGFVIAICSLETGFKPYEAVARTLKPGWNEVSFPRSTIDKIKNNTSAGYDDESNDIFIRFNCGGWTNFGYTNTPGDVLYIDSIYIELPNYGDTLTAPVPSIENAAAFVEADLGNNNIYTLSFNEALRSQHISNGKLYSVSDAVKVYEFDSSISDYVETEQSYSVSAEGSELNVAFDSELATAAYKIVLDSEAILSESGKKLSKDLEFYFSVGMESALFVVTSTNPESGKLIDDLSEGFGFVINFNNEVDDFDLDMMFEVTANGKPFSDYAVSKDYNSVKLTFKNELVPDCTYAITLSDDLADVNGFFIQGVKEYSFRTADVVGADGVIFDASVPAYLDVPFDGDINKPSSAFSIEKETQNTLGGDATFRFNHDVLPKGKQWDAILSLKAVPDISKYAYINYNIYSPEATNEKINILLRTYEGVLQQSANKQRWRYPLATDWQGWKTVSIPISKMTAENGMGNYFDATIINIGGWDFTKANAGHFLFDRIWLSDKLPSSVEYLGSEFENGSCYLENDLGGDNTYTFTFNGNLAGAVPSGAVKVEKYDGSEFVEYSDFELNSNGDKLGVDFGSALASGTTLKITLDPKKVLSETYAVGTGDIQELVFTVDGPSPYFELESSSVENGANVSELENITLKFNNELDKTHYVPDYISLYCDGEKVYNAYDYAIDGNNLTLTFTKELKNGGKYSINISPEYVDSFGNEYVGVSSISFTYGEVKSGGASTVIFSAGNVIEENGEKSFDLPSSNFSFNETDINLYPQNAKFTYKKSTNQSAQVNGYFVKEKVVPLDGMKYFNMLAYSPEVTENTAQIIFYTDCKNNKYVDSKRYQLALNWKGWKLISIPLTDLMNTGATIDGILLNTGGWRMTVPTDGYLLFDAVWASADKPSEIALESSSFADGYADAEIAGQLLNLKFNTALDFNAEPSVSLVDKNGTEVTDFEFSVKNDEITIIFGTLSASTTYTLTVDNVVSEEFSKISEPITMNFTTKADGVFIKSFDYNNKTAKAEIVNLSENAVNVTVVAYAIGEDNTALEKISEAVSVDTSITSELSFTTQKEIKDVKLFVMDSNGRFVSGKYFSGKSDSDEFVSKVSGSSASVSIDSYDINVNVFDAAIILSAVSDAAVVEITNQNSEIVAANIVRSDENGKAEFYYVFSSDMPSGNYTITATSDGKSASKTFAYLSSNDRTEFIGDANGTSVSKLSSFIKGQKDVFAMSDCTEAQIDDFADVIIENGPFNNYAEALEFAQSVPVILDEINSASWAKLTVLIEGNNKLLGGTTNSDVNYFLNLSDKNQNAVTQILSDMLPADTYEELTDKLSDAIDKYRDSLGSGASGGMGGGSGSRGNSMGGSFPVVPDANLYTPVEAETVFTDLAYASWATDSIMTLYKSGVISYPADGKFRPNDNITREEFVKMLVCAFGETAPYSEHRFTDEAEGAWYNAYLNKAYALGITKGYPDGSFGIGERISREDMITMCARTLEILGQNVAVSGELTFTDAGYVSDYAYAYVNALTQLGVINGMSDGSFAPKATATRAQAAKVIAKLMEIY